MRSIGGSFAPNAISPIIYADNGGGSLGSPHAPGALENTMHHQAARALHLNSDL